MSHDVAFAALQARKRAAEAAGPPKVTWRRVSPLTGGGSSGLGPNGILVWAADPVTDGRCDFGRIVDGIRITAGTATGLAPAKARAEALAVPDPVLSGPQTAVLEFLCSALRASGTLLHKRGVRAATIESLQRLGLVLSTTAGARGSIYHLTDLGCAVIRCAAEHTQTEGGPTMTDSILTESPAAAGEAAAPAAVEAAEAPKKKRAPARKQAEMAQAAATEKKPKGPSDESKSTHDAVMAGIKGLARGAKTVKKERYVRVSTSAGKTIAYVGHPSRNHVRVKVFNPGAGNVVVKVANDADVAKVVELASARVDYLKGDGSKPAARDAAKAAA